MPHTKECVYCGLEGSNRGSSLLGFFHESCYQEDLSARKADEIISAKMLLESADYNVKHCDEASMSDNRVFNNAMTKILKLPPSLIQLTEEERAIILNMMEENYSSEANPKEDVDPLKDHPELNLN